MAEKQKLPMTEADKKALIAKKRQELSDAEKTVVETKASKDSMLERSYWRPRLWVALTTIVTFILGVYCSYIEIVSVVERPTRPLFCLFLLGAIPITLLLERLRK